MNVYINLRQVSTLIHSFDFISVVIRKTNIFDCEIEKDISYIFFIL